MWPSQRGLAEKPILLINGEFRPETTRCSKCDHLLHDGSVRLDFMTDDVNEAEEMRIQTVGHCVPAEAPQEVVTAIEKLLRMPEQRLDSTPTKLNELEQSARG
jgi:hypothetical protein